MKYLIADKASKAITVATTDCGWKRTGRTEFVDNHGDPVRVISSAEQLRGRPKGTVVYMGPGCKDRKDWIEVMHLWETGYVALHYPDLCPEAKKHFESKGWIAGNNPWRY